MTSQPPLSPGAHYELVIATRDSMFADNRNYSDADLLARRFGIDVDEDWGRSLMDADEEKLLALAQYLRVAPENESRPATEDVVGGVTIDAYTELVSAETALRDVVRATVPDWLDKLDQSEIDKLSAKQLEEDKRRDGVTVSRDLLDYTEIYLLRSLIEKNWEHVKPVLDDLARTKTYLDIIFSIRNTIGHSRPVVPSERLLLAGAAGQIRHQLARYRSSQDGSALHYSSIDSARDSFGTDGKEDLGLYGSKPQADTPRLSVGDTVTFSLAATDPRDRMLSWQGYVIPADKSVSAYMYYADPRFEVSGAAVNLDWVVDERDVGEGTNVVFTLKNSSKYQRRDGIDDARTFVYCVNPPLD